MKTLLLTACMFTCATYALAQTKTPIDSLTNILQTAKDTNKVNVLNDIAKLFYETNIDKAIEYAHRAKHEASKLNFAKGEAQALTALGAFSLRKGNLKQALQYQTNGLHIRERIKDKKGEAISLNNIGLLYSEQGNYTIASEYFLKALKIRETIQDKAGLFSTLTNIGLLYAQQAGTEQSNPIIYDKALGYYQEAYDIAKEIKNKKSEATVLYNIADIHNYRKDYKKALEYHFKALEMRKKIQDTYRLPSSYYSIGEVYIKLKNVTEANKYLDKAYTLATENEDELTLTKILHQIGIARQEEKKYTEAIKALQEGLALAQKIEDKPDILGIKTSLSQIYEAMGNTTLAFQYFKEATYLNDTLFNAQNSKQLSGLQSKFDIEKEQAKIKLLEKDRENQQLFNYSLIVGFLLILIIAYMLYRRQRKQKRVNRLLSDKNIEIEKQKDTVELEKQKADNLLLNILPAEVAQELKETGKTKVRYFDSATLLFADVKGFSALAKKLTPQDLIAELDATFSKMDEISLRYGLERIKTIGDCYMACGGLPHANKTHHFDVVLAALGIQHWMEQEYEKRNGNFWQVRLGLHTGEVVAGVIGKTKFAYDVWGNTVNLASRMESGGEVGKVNVTETTYDLVKDYFIGAYREEIEAKNIGKVKAYFITRLKPEFSADTDGIIPNDAFWEKYTHQKTL